jgi:hypothetical protein
MKIIDTLTQEDDDALAAAVPPAEITRHIADLQRIAEHLLDIAIDGKGSFDNRLRQILTEQRRTIKRVLNDDIESMTPHELQRVAVYDLMTILLMSRALDQLVEAERVDTPQGEQNRRVRTALRSAMATFEHVLGKNRLSPLRSPEPLSQLLFQCFSDITAADAVEDAAAIKELFRR